MKKSLSIVFGLLTLLAGAAETSVESKNTLGIKRTEYTSNSEIAVGVPWLQAADKEGVTVAELITTGLTEGDQIQVYSLADKTYFSWHYDGTKWTADTKTDGPTVPTADSYTLKRGTAFWYIPASASGGFFTQVGTYSDAAITTKVNKVHADGETEGTFANPVHNLLVNPKYAEFNITALNGKCGENDVIIVPNTGANTGARYRYHDGVWGRDIDQEVEKFGVKVTQKVFTVIGTGGGSVSAGTAFWYLSAGGAPEIVW